MIETRKAKLLANTRKTGSGGTTFRATLPTSWIRQMGLSEDYRDLKLVFNGKEITIKNNKEEVEMLEKLLGVAKVEIEKEIREMSYIDDSDNCDRFLDNLVRELVEKEILKGSDDIDLYYEKEGEIEELADTLLGEVQDYMKKTYESDGEVDKAGNYTGCYYKDKEGLKNWRN